MALHPPTLGKEVTGDEPTPNQTSESDRTFEIQEFLSQGGIRKLSGSPECLYR